LIPKDKGSAAAKFAKEAREKAERIILDFIAD
jgi:hypothetical protein